MKNKHRRSLRYIHLWSTLLLAFLLSGCWAYKLNDASVPADVRTVRIGFIENKAPLVNPQLSPALSERLRQKILNQTRLTQVNNDNADWILTGFVQDYAVSTTGITDQRVASNRLTVTVKMTLTKKGAAQPEDITITRNFDFNANLALQTYQVQNLDEIVRFLTDDIFNRIFSNW